jgi:hypothetical protein
MYTSINISITTNKSQKIAKKTKISPKSKLLPLPYLPHWTTRRKKNM